MSTYGLRAYNEDGSLNIEVSNRLTRKLDTVTLSCPFVAQYSLSDYYLYRGTYNIADLAQDGTWFFNDPTFTWSGAGDSGVMATTIYISSGVVTVDVVFYLYVTSVVATLSAWRA